jgi:hypothetical protein
VELRAGSPDVIDDYQAHDRMASGSRDEMLDALYGAWKDDIEAGQVSLMIAGDLGTVHELNARARADRVSTGQVAQDGLAVAGGATAGVGDHVVTRQNNRCLTTGRRWVRNGDQWTVTATNQDGSMTVARSNGGGQVVLPAPYVTEHVDLAYASTTHRAQGRTVDTAHAMVSPTTTREVLYVSATRGREVNRLYVDTHYDPDPQTSHGTGAVPMTTKEVLTGVLRSEGADIAAHDMIRRQQFDAEGMERLAAEYSTLATAAQEDRWNALLATAGLSESQMESIRSSEAFGPLLASLRVAEAHSLNVDNALPELVSSQSFNGAGDLASVLHGRVDRWTETSRTRRLIPDNYVAGLIPRAQGVTDPEMVQALTERHLAMEARARTLAVQAIESGAEWMQRLGPVPSDPAHRALWVHEVSTVAAYRDRWHISGQQGIGGHRNVGSAEQMQQQHRALKAVKRALTVARETNREQSSSGRESQITIARGVDL